MVGSVALPLLTVLVMLSGLTAGGVAVALRGRSAMSPTTAFGWGCVLGPAGWIVVGVCARRASNTAPQPGPPR